MRPLIDSCFSLLIFSPNLASPIGGRNETQQRKDGGSCDRRVVERVRCKRASGSITAKHATKTILFISINLLTLGHSTRRTEVIFNAAAAAGFGYTSASRPAFVAPIYAAAASMKNAPVPSDAPPLFLAAATDDQLNLAPDSIQLYNQWTAAQVRRTVYVRQRRPRLRHAATRNPH